MNSSDKARPKFRDVKEQEGSLALWETKDSQKMYVKDMQNDHLLNSIRSMEKRYMYLSNLESSCYCGIGPQGEMAQDAFNSGMMELEDEMDDTMWWINELRKEANRRGLKINRR